MCARSACNPPAEARAGGVGVCAWGQVSAAPRHSGLGCSVCLCVLRLGFRLRPATHGRGLGCVCACACAPLVPRHYWLGCAVWVCVLGLRFRLRPATPGWCVGVLCLLMCALRLYPGTPGFGVGFGCVCLGSGVGCAPPLLAGVLGCVCACVCAPLVPGHSWLGCVVWACLLGLGLWVCPATPGWGVGVLCVLVCALRLYPANRGWGVRCGRVCLGSGFGCAAPLLAGLFGYACLCARSACTPPALAGACGVGVCAWRQVSAAPRHSWLGCAVRVFVLGLGFRLRPATPEAVPRTHDPWPKGL